MKQKKLVIAAVALVIILAIIGIFVFFDRGTQTATHYEDTNGWVYKCSKPVDVKNQGATYGNGTPSPTPVNPSDASKYCHKIGIE